LRFVRQITPHHSKNDRLAKGRIDEKMKKGVVFLLTLSIIFYKHIIPSG